MTSISLVNTKKNQQHSNNTVFNINNTFKIASNFSKPEISQHDQIGIENSSNLEIEGKVVPKFDMINEDNIAYDDNTGNMENNSDSDFDPLDAFMSSLYDTGDVTEQFEDITGPGMFSSHKSNTKKSSTSQSSIVDIINPNGSNFITLEQITGHLSKKSSKNKDFNGEASSVSTKDYDPADWKSDISFSPAPVTIDEDKEEQERRDFLEALRGYTVPVHSLSDSSAGPYVTEEIIDNKEKEKASNNEKLGRIFAGEGDMIEESEVEAKKKSALDILEEQKRGKELRPVDHSTIEYMPFRKNLYIVPKVLARLSEEELKMKRDLLQMKVRGKGCPAPVDSWDQVCYFL
jgi:hypothetical protein